MLNPLHSGKMKKVPSLRENAKKQKAGGKSARLFQLDQLARDLAQEWNEMAMGCADFAGGWQAG